MTFTAGCIYLLLVACSHCRCRYRTRNDGDTNSALFQPQNSICPAAPFGSEAVAAPSESECVLRCTLSTECRLSVYLRDSATCYILDEMQSTAVCGSGMIARMKLPPTAPLAMLSLTFSSQIVLLYDFRKGYKNILNTCWYPAEPVNIAEQNSVDGVRLQGSSSSHVRVSTPGFYKYFNYGQKFSIFFQGKFGMNSSKKCFGAFVDVTRNNMYSSTFHADNYGRISAKLFFPTGEPFHSHWTSKDALVVDSVQRVASIGINFAGEEFANQAYLNGSTVMRNTWGGGPRHSAGDLFTIHNDLLIGNCMTSGIEPFDGWLQCWALLTGNLDTSQFDQLRSLCSS